jgi:hypothetical protein
VTFEEFGIANGADLYGRHTYMVWLVPVISARAPAVAGDN